MIDIDIINEEIDCLLEEETTFETCEKLACLYIVKSNIEKESAKNRSDYSEFANAATMLDIEDLIYVLDEHMDAIRVVAPKEYDNILSKMKKLI